MKRRLYAATALVLLAALWPWAGEHRLEIAAHGIRVVLTGGE